LAANREYRCQLHQEVIVRHCVLSNVAPNSPLAPKLVDISLTRHAPQLKLKP
jgi:hypothetical protein